MKTFILLLFLFNLVIFSAGCKKDNSNQGDKNQVNQVADSLVGNYIMSGYYHEYDSLAPPYAADTTIQITNDTISVAKINDSTIMAVGNYLFGGGIVDSAYVFGYHQCISCPTIQLSFSVANIKSVKLSIGAIGSDTELSGTKVQ